MIDEQQKDEGDTQNEPSRETPAEGESKIEEFAEGVGRVLGAAKVKAEALIEQGQTVAKRLESVRDAASGVITQLTEAATGGAPEAKGVVGVIQPAPLSKRQRRKLSPEARAKSAEALRARWAERQAEARASGRRRG